MVSQRKGRKIMKKIIICFILVVMVLSLCACQPTTTDECGIERDLFNGRFAVIIKNNDYSSFIVYDINTKVVYYLESDSYNGYLSPYLIYQDGTIYGAIFENGKIIPVPYASTPLH